MTLAKGTIIKMESVQSPTHSQAKNFSVRKRITRQSHYFIKYNPKEIGRREREADSHRADETAPFTFSTRSAMVSRVQPVTGTGS